MLTSCPWSAESRSFSFSLHEFSPKEMQAITYSIGGCSDDAQAKTHIEITLVITTYHNGPTLRLG